MSFLFKRKGLRLKRNIGDWLERTHLGLPQIFDRGIERHTHVFYFLLKEKTCFVVLKEAYMAGGDASIQEHPMLEVRSKYTGLMEESREIIKCRRSGKAVQLDPEDREESEDSKGANSADATGLSAVLTVGKRLRSTAISSTVDEGGSATAKMACGDTGVVSGRAGDVGGVFFNTPACRGSQGQPEERVASTTPLTTSSAQLERASAAPSPPHAGGAVVVEGAATSPVPSPTALDASALVSVETVGGGDDMAVECGAATLPLPTPPQFRRRLWEGWVWGRMLQWHGQPRPPSFFSDGGTFCIDGFLFLTSASFVAISIFYAYDPDDTLCVAFAAT
ncbi:hypothetical protein QYE76_001653 [Lolium multiflorum]|uniref:PORR domain-containing protein n=1 Tax=Lolium multiflorum TaxID=4521 RepID=A0AAD8RLS0_LOLMU|nr:hypothetical protein QYE76_001653 [Lolium multiflorum]